MKKHLEERILEKVRKLSVEQIVLLEQYIDCLEEEDGKLVAAAQKLSESVFDKIWNNSEDSEYDDL